MARPRPDRFLEVEMGYVTPCHIPLKNDGTPMRLDKDGYSVASFGLYDGLGKTMHRRLWVALNGLVPDDKVLDHLCKHRPCCNIEHLEMTTQAQNVRRAARTKLTPEQVTQIQAMRAAGAGPTVIGRRFNISPSHVSNLCAGKYWKDGEPSYRTIKLRQEKALRRAVKE